MTNKDKVQVLWVALRVWMAVGWILGAYMIYKEFFK